MWNFLILASARHSLHRRSNISHDQTGPTQAATDIVEAAPSNVSLRSMKPRTNTTTILCLYSSGERTGDDPDDGADTRSTTAVASSMLGGGPARMARGRGAAQDALPKIAWRTRYAFRMSSGRRRPETSAKIFSASSLGTANGLSARTSVSSRRGISSATDTW